MNKKIAFIFFVAIFMFSFSINNTQASTGAASQAESKNENKIQIKKLFTKKSKDVWGNNNLIAHAFGAVDGKDYTNSFEAFEQNYKKGYRVFEVDFLLTSDNRLIARHDWSYDRALLFKQNPPHNLGTPWDYDSVMNQKIYDAYSPVDVALVIEIMEKHPDVYIVTDSKYFDSEIVRETFQQIVDAAGNDPSILKRVIPQIYNQEMLKDVRGVYNFPEIIYTLYMSKDNNQQVIDFVNSEKIRVVTMPEGRNSSEFVQGLRDVGTYTFVHTINDFSLAKKHAENGTYGFYSDLLLPEEFRTK